jgi:uroporphyrin-III C-methyltransferase
VVHDRLVHPDLLALAPQAELISAAKAPRQPTMTQEEINALLVEKGRAGLEVVRLKGGDPMVFGRGGEEAAALAEAGVPFEVVPGVTSAIAAPAYAGVPVTMRNEALSFTVVTGHEDPNGAVQVDWKAIAATGGTIVVLMGAAKAREVADQLLQAGLAADTPTAVVQWGTYERQDVQRITLDQLGREPVSSPATIVIGAVAAHAFEWFRPS